MDWIDDLGARRIDRGASRVNLGPIRQALGTWTVLEVALVLVDLPVDLFT